MKRKTKKTIANLMSYVGYITTVTGAISSVVNLIEKFSTKKEMIAYHYTPNIDKFGPMASEPNIFYGKLNIIPTEPNYMLYSIIVLVIGFIILLTGCLIKRHMKKDVTN